MKKVFILLLITSLSTVYASSHTGEEKDLASLHKPKKMEASPSQLGQQTDRADRVDNQGFIPHNMGSHFLQKAMQEVSLSEKQDKTLDDHSQHVLHQHGLSQEAQAYGTKWPEQALNFIQNQAAFKGQNLKLTQAEKKVLAKEQALLLAQQELELARQELDLSLEKGGDYRQLPQLIQQEQQMMIKMQQTTQKEMEQKLLKMEQNLESTQHELKEREDEVTRLHSLNQKLRRQRDSFHLQFQHAEKVGEEELYVQFKTLDKQYDEIKKDEELAEQFREKLAQLRKLGWEVKLTNELANKNISKDSVDIQRKMSALKIAYLRFKNNLASLFFWSLTDHMSDAPSDYKDFGSKVDTNAYFRRNVSLFAFNVLKELKGIQETFIDLSKRLGEPMSEKEFEEDLLRDFFGNLLYH